MARKYPPIFFIALFTVAAIWPFPGDCAQNGAGVRILGRDMSWGEALFINQEGLAPHAVQIRAGDPNFPKDGIKKFTGIRLDKLFLLAGLETGYGITMIGSDQYVGYLPPDRAADAVLAWKMENNPIPGLKGGPLKIVFPNEGTVHASCYTWYVDTIVQDLPAPTGLMVSVKGEEKRYGFSSLLSDSAPLSPSMFSIAQGCRSGFAEISSAKSIRSVSLSRLIEGEGNPPLTSVVLVPYSGPRVKLNPDILKFGAQIIVSYGENPLHPALGGPFSIVFPVEEHPEIREMVPESGALFFLEKIIAD